VQQASGELKVLVLDLIDVRGHFVLDEALCGLADHIVRLAEVLGREHLRGRHILDEVRAALSDGLLHGSSRVAVLHRL